MLESYRFGEILLLDFPYTDGAGASRRPALVLLDTGDNDVVVSRVTGQPARDQYDIEVNDLGSAGLRLQSIVRLHKLATLKKRLVQRRLGSLSEVDQNRVRQALGGMWTDA
jgi:mRNA interferase MazF